MTGASIKTKPAGSPAGRLFFEALVIVSSILLAFGIDAWWEERKDRVEEQEILHGLYDEFSQNRERLERDMLIDATNSQILVAILEAIDSGVWNEQEIPIDGVIGDMLSPSTSDLGNGVFDALVNAGRIELLSNKDLRNKLAAWNGIFDEVRDDQANNSKMVLEQMVPYFMRNGVPVSAAFVSFNYAWPIKSRSIKDDADSLERLLTDPEFRVMAELRYGYKIHLKGEIARALDAIDQILIEIERSLN